MPTYEYRCDKCGHQFDVFQRITDDPVSKCTECDGSVQRLIGATNFILKGNGWHKSDYSPASSQPDKSAEFDSGEGCGGDKSSPQCQGCPAANSD